MERHGVKQDDVHVSVITGSGPRAECLRTGECAAAAVNEPFDGTLAAQGFTALGTTAENPPIPFIAEVVNKTWAERNQATVVGFIRAQAAAMRFINDPANAEAVWPIVAEVTKGSEASARETLTRFYYNAKLPYLPRQAELDPEGFGRALELMAEYDQIPKPAPATNRFLDLRYAKAAGIQ
jgi:ABC-type nitrate/sulfonate/bicarbonate transport system substrate-binding protein